MAGRNVEKTVTLRFVAPFNSGTPDRIALNDDKNTVLALLSAIALADLDLVSVVSVVSRELTGEESDKVDAYWVAEVKKAKSQNPHDPFEDILYSML